MNQFLQKAIAFCVLISCTNAPHLQAQGLFINEFTNGSAGAQEFIELIVIGSDANPTGTVDISGWIIDDNNGEFEGGTGTGLATGHLRFVAGCYTNLPVGSMLVLYNANDPHPDLPPADPYDANGDGVYIIPHTDPCIEVCTSLPSSANFAYSPCTYQPTTIGSWGNIGFRNAGDAVQVRRPNATFYHGYAYGDITAPFPTFPPEFGGGSSFNVATGAGTDNSFTFTCGFLNLNSNYTKVIDSIASSPGRANDPNNNGLWHVLRAGDFNYSDFADPDNCPITFPLQLLSFEATATENHNLLRWQLAKIEANSYVKIKSSYDGIHFELLATEALPEGEETQVFSYEDVSQFSTTYYQLEFIEPNQANIYSPIRVLSRQNKDGLYLYPNPANTHIIVATPDLQQGGNYQIVSTLGAVVLSGEFAPLHNISQIELNSLAAGAYYFRFYSQGNTLIRKFIKK
jgi:hypothetical protein